MEMPMETAPLRAYLVDDEPLAIERLARLLASADSACASPAAPPIRRKPSTS
jgi:hypothetical protein